jgi:hypothetical protein
MLWRCPQNFKSKISKKLQRSRISSTELGFSQLCSKSHKLELVRNLTKPIGRCVPQGSYHVSIHPNQSQTLRKMKCIKTQKRGSRKEKPIRKRTQEFGHEFQRNDCFISFLNNVRHFAKLHRWRITHIEGLKLASADLSRDSGLETKN